MFAYLITYLFYVIYNFGNHTFVTEKRISHLIEAFMLVGVEFFYKVFFKFFFNKTNCWKSLIYKDN